MDTDQNDETPEPQEPPAQSAAPKQSGVLRDTTGMETAQGAIAAALAGMVALLTLLVGVGAPLHGPDLDLFGAPGALTRVVWTPEHFDAQPHAPLTLFTYAANRATLGTAPGALHGVNVLLATAATALCLIWLRGAVPRAPVAATLGAALLFGLHPLHAAAAGVASGRPALLGACFGFLALMLLARCAAQPGRTVSAIAGLASYLIAAAACLPWVALPLLFAAVEAARGGHARQPAALPMYGALFALGGMVLIAHAAASPDAVFGAWTPVADTPWIWAARVATLDGHWPDSVGAPWGVAAWAVALAAAGIGLALALRGVVVGAALAWIGAAWMAEVLFAPLGPGSGTLPLAGVALAATAAFPRLPSGLPRQAAGAVLAAIVAACGAVSYWQTAAWGDPVAYWSARASAPGGGAPALRRLGVWLAHEARHAPDATQRDEARRAGEEVWRGVLAMAPDDGAAAGALGGLLVLDGRGAEAEPLLMRAIAANPFDAQATLDLALALDRWLTFRDGRFSLPTQRPTPEDLDRQRRAVDYFARAAALGHVPREAQARHGFTLALLGDREAGLPLLRAALGDDPEVAPLIAQFEESIREAAALEAAARQALASGAPTAEARLQRATAHLRQDRLVPARHGFQQLARDPAQAAAWVQLGLLSQRLGERDAFLAEFGPVQRENAPLWVELAARLASAGQWDAAEAVLAACARVATDAPPPHGALSEIALALGQADRAEAHLRAWAGAHPGDPAPWSRLAAIAEAAGRAADAAAHRAEAARRGGAETPPEDATAPTTDDSPRRAIERTVIR